MITIYSADATDFSNNGLGTLNPSSCEVTETLNGEYEVVLEHPLDEEGKWKKIADQRIIRVPVPLGLTPYIDLLDRSVIIETTSRGVYSASKFTTMRAGPGTQYKICDVRKDMLVVVLGTENGWYKIVTDGTIGYVNPDDLVYEYTRQTVKQMIGEVVESKQLRDQPFRIYRVVPSLNGVTVYARHLFYDMLDNWVKKYTKASGDDAAVVVKNCAAAALDTCGFTFYSDLTSTAKTFEITDKNLVDAYMGEDGVIDTFGGELCRDWYDVYITSRVGNDSGIVISEGKNLTGISYDVDSTDVVTRIIPRGQTSNSKTLYLPEVYIESDNSDDYPHQKYMTLDVEEAKVGDDLTTAQAYTKMRAAANQAFTDGADMPTVTLDVDFLNCADTEEYKQYGLLQNIYLGDSVKVKSSTLGINVSMRMTQYTYDCLLKKYTKMTLGTIADTVESSTISSRQIASGTITGGKLSLESVGEAQLKDLSVGAAKIQAAAIEIAHIQQAAIDALTAQSITAVRATINQIASQEIKTDELVAALAKVTALYVEDLTASSVTADRLGAALAAFSVVTAGTATFDEATVRHLIASALNVTDATADKVFISNLAIDYANIVSANVGHLCIKAEDGNYYALSVDSSGNVTATQTTVTSSEIAAGVTTGGRTIIDTEIVASDLSASNLKAVYALINRIDAARIDVDVLTAREAWISWLHTADISSNTSIKLALDSTQKVHRSESVPESANINDLWVVPSTGFTYQLTESEADTNDYSFSVTSDGILQHTSPASPGYTMVLEDGELNVTYDGSEQVFFALDDDGDILITTASWKRVKDSELTAAEQVAVNAANKADANSEQLDVINRYMEFDDDGLKQYLPGSPYYTLVDNDGFYVKSTQKADAIVSMDAADGVVTQSQRMGNITCKATTTGGWVWQAAT